AKSVLRQNPTDAGGHGGQKQAEPQPAARRLPGRKADTVVVAAISAEFLDAGTVAIQAQRRTEGVSRLRAAARHDQSRRRDNAGARARRASGADEWTCSEPVVHDPEKHALDLIGGVKRFSSAPVTSARSAP